MLLNLLLGVVNKYFIVDAEKQVASGQMTPKFMSAHGSSSQDSQHLKTSFNVLFLFGVILLYSRFLNVNKGCWWLVVVVVWLRCHRHRHRHCHTIEREAKASAQSV